MRETSGLAEMKKFLEGSLKCAPCGNDIYIEVIVQKRS